MVAINKHGNNSRALHFLKITFRKLGVPIPCEKLRKASLWDWFTPHADLKPNYIHAQQLGTTIKKTKYNMSLLEEYPKLQDTFVTMLQKMKEAS
jgi:hypothetical protein